MGRIRRPAVFLAVVLAVVLCFGFVGVKEVHAATNKVINENTGVSYDTLSAALAALGTGNANDSVTLTVDGTVHDTESIITIDYAGELTIQGINDANIVTTNSGTNYSSRRFYDDYFPSIVISEKSRIKKISNISLPARRRVEEYGPNTSRYYNYGYNINIYGVVNEMVGLANGGINVYNGGRIDRLVGTSVGEIGCRVKEGGEVGTITGYLWRLIVDGSVDTVDTVDTINDFLGYGISTIEVQQNGNIGTIKDSKFTHLFISGTVDTLQGCTLKNGILDDYTYASALYIGSMGRLNRIVGGCKFNDSDGPPAISNESQYPVYLEPDLNGLDLTEGYGGYGVFSGGGTIEDFSGTIVYPTSASGYLYQMSSEADSDGYYHLTVSNIPGNPVNPTLSKRLLSNDTATVPDMTFTFSFTQQSEWDGVSYVSASTPIADKSVTITDTSNRLTSDAYVGDLTDKKLLEGKVDNVLTDFAPTAAGTYCYLVKENVPNPQLADVTYTGSEFIMLVEVEDTGGTLKPKTVTNILYKDSSGKTKADYTTPPTIFDEKQELIFYNNYGTTGGTTPTGIITNILPFIVIGGAGAGGLALYAVLNAKRRKKDIS